MIPKSIEDVTTQWLSQVLDADIRRLHCTQIGQGVGLMGDIYRVELHHAESVQPAKPGSVVVKLPSSFEENRQQGVALGMFEAEVRFYNELVPDNVAGLPQVFLADIEPGTANFVIVMEDLSGLTMVNQSDGMSGDQAMAVVKVLAQLHTLWWGRVQTEYLDWIPTMTGPRIEFVDQFLAQVFPAFSEKFAQYLPPSGLEVYEKFVGNYATINRHIATRSPWTLAHQDFRVENLLFGPAGSDQVVVIDWQGIGRGPGVYDLGYVLGGSMAPEERRNNEAQLIEAYHQELVAGGITDYSIDALHDDYGHTHLMGGLATSILTGGAMDLSNERGTQLIATMASRHAQAALDHQGLERLSAVLQGH